MARTKEKSKTKPFWEKNIPLVDSSKKTHKRKMIYFHRIAARETEPGLSIYFCKFKSLISQEDRIIACYNDGESEYDTKTSPSNAANINFERNPSKHPLVLAGSPLGSGFLSWIPLPDSQHDELYQIVRKAEDDSSRQLLFRKRYYYTFQKRRLYLAAVYKYKSIESGCYGFARQVNSIPRSLFVTRYT